MKGRRFLAIFLTIWVSLLLSSVIANLVINIAAGTLKLQWHYQSFLQMFMPLISVLFILIVIAFIATIILYLFLFKDEGLLLAKLRALQQRKYDDPVLIQTSDSIYLSEDVEIALKKIRESGQNMEVALQAKTVADETNSQLDRNELVKQERQRIARELHDSVSQQLFAMTMLLSAIQEQSEGIDPVNQQLIAKVADMVDQAQAEMRALLLHLRPISLTNQSLAKGIEQLFKELETKVKINFEASVNDVQLLPEVENHLFRIVQELLSNSLRHANPNIIECQLYEKDRNIYLRFSDDGVGFDMEKEVSNSGGYGLKNIRERVAQLGGTVNVISFINQGTLVQIVVPRQMEESND